MPKRNHSEPRMIAPKIPSTMLTVPPKQQMKSLSHPNKNTHELRTLRNVVSNITRRAAVQSAHDRSRKDRPLGKGKTRAKPTCRSYGVRRRSDYSFAQWRTILMSTARIRGYGTPLQRSFLTGCKVTRRYRYGWGRKLPLDSHGTRGRGHHVIAARLRGARYHALRLRAMLDQVKVARSKNVLNSTWVDRLMLPWATSACESWQRLLTALPGLAGESRGSQLRETSRARKWRASAPTFARLLDELGRVARFSVCRALLIVQAFCRSAVGIRVPSVDMSDKYWLAAQAIGSLLTPTALMALVLGLWGITAKLHWTTGFVILTGPFSRWEIWFCVAALLKSCEFVLNRMAQRAIRH